jgi:hypothetical protein
MEVRANGQSVQHWHLQDDDLGCGKQRHGHRGNIGGSYERSSPEICHAGKSFLSAGHTGSGAQAYLGGIEIGPRRTRRQGGRDVLHLRGIAADLHARGASDAGSPLNLCPELDLMNWSPNCHVMLGNIPKSSDWSKSRTDGKRLEPRAGLEPATCRLRIGCSTTELPRRAITTIAFAQKTCQFIREICMFLAREGIHGPADRHADQQEQEQRPHDVFHAVDGAPPAQETESHRDNQCEQRHGLEVRELKSHCAVYAFRPRAAS